MGIKQLMLVAEESNHYSRKVIERNGGQQLDVMVGTLSAEAIVRYLLPV
jgi:predicted acetyltransferase